MTVMGIYENLININRDNKVGVLITSDQSAAFGLVNHTILRKKLIHIGYKFESVKLIMDYLTDRSQYVEINSNVSNIIKNRNIGVFQGSILSGLLYVIYTLDINSITHEKKHKNNISEYKCHKPKIDAFVDDTYGVIRTNENNVWNDIKEYTMKLNSYYTNNRLMNNINKTNIMIITKQNNINNGSINIDDKIIKHVPRVKILGTTFNDCLDWSDHVRVINH